jgi:secreted PhoX family phosphatase
MAIDHAQDASRRAFLRRAAAFGIGFAGLSAAFVRGAFADEAARMGIGGAAGGGGSGGFGFGPLVRDPAGIFDLPEGFTYEVISRAGEEMDDGLLVPGRPDGMAAFAGEDGMTIVVRNHELSAGEPELGPFGRGNDRLGRLASSKVYDRGHGSTPSIGGTTTLVYDTVGRRVVSQRLSLAGTNRNCAGGPTPWGSWLTCEEDVTPRGGPAEKMHGYVFEVVASSRECADPVPIREMGRFNHEAVCVDPKTGIVYLTEDRLDGLLYRFVPKERGKLHRGGSLEALVVRGAPRRDTRNWSEADRAREGVGAVGGDVRAVGIGDRFECDWIVLDDVDTAADDLRERGFALGAARFARGEGMWWGRDGAYFACTAGGAKGLGQLWRYTPGEDEGEPASAGKPARGGVVELLIEPNDARVVANADNLTVSPSGDLVVCEDGKGPNRLLLVSPRGEVVPLAINRLSASELAGVCFSPDGTTLFVNIQHDHMTLAVRGPFRR